MATSEFTFKYSRAKLVIHAQIEIEDNNYVILIHIHIGKGYSYWRCY